MFGDALSALFSGAFGSWYAFGSGTLVRATPLILTGLAVALATVLAGCGKTIHEASAPSSLPMLALAR